MIKELRATRVVLADDHDVVRQGLRRLLERMPGIEVIGEARDGLSALLSVERLRPDVLLLDIEMPVMDGIEVARRIQASGLSVRILVLSAYDDQEYIRALLDIGVSGYLVKGEAPGKIVEAVHRVVQGEKGIASPQVLKKIQKPSGSHPLLSYQELEILKAKADGKSDSAIAQQLKISINEYQQCVQKLLIRIEAKSLQEAVNFSFREGWIS
jgi:DNA-binding NarL/FixJ family response regulator